jgi:ectoine hydroxylase-related dioxygenase (phytanoyl-CoA dioxygenase family)
MIESLKTSVAFVVFWLGYYWYKVSGKTPWYSYLSLRKLFYSTNTQFNKRLSAKIASKNKGYGDLGSVGVLGKLTQEGVEAISAAIQRDGYFIFDAVLEDETIQRLIELSFRTKAKLTPAPKPGEEWAYFDRSNPIAIKYQFMEEDLAQNETVQSLMADESMLAVAQSFLKTKPILDLVSMWWSTAISRTASSEVAQLFHWDMERIKFIKFFFYLTDVDAETGPHCFVRESNNGFPAAVRRDGRVSDEDINTTYDKNKIVEIAGRKGTIIAVDTSGFHKGKNLAKGDRLLLQFEFSNSLFGVNCEYHTINSVSTSLRKAVSSFPYVYQRFKLK